MPLSTNLGVGSPTSGIQLLVLVGQLRAGRDHHGGRRTGVGKLLSKPKVITQNNQKATVKQGTKIPVQTSSTTRFRCSSWTPCWSST